MTPRCRQIFFCFLTIFFSINAVSQQITISGTIYDITRKTPIEYVSVLSNSGRGASTDSLGRYSIIVSEKDSIWFSFLNKPTPKYAVANIANPGAFDISILKKVHELPGVFLKLRNYHMDSLQNRSDYEKIFNYRRPGISATYTPGSAAGLDFDEFLNIFKFRKNKRMLAYQRYLQQEEKEKYVAHRFNKSLVRKLTGLSTPQLDSFMAEFRPTYQMVAQWNDLEFGQFVVEAYKYYRQGIKVDKTLFRKFEAEETEQW